MLRFADMEVVQGARASLRPARRGTFRLLMEAVREIRSRRRLVRYLVDADLQKKGANTLLGNIWWILDPLLQMAVYVVFVSVIVGSTQDAYAL